MHSSVSSRRPAGALVLLSVAALALGACRDKPETYVDKAAKAVGETKVAAAGLWSDAKNYTFERRDEMSRQIKALDAKFKADVSHFRASYAEAEASASRRAAMAELQNAESDFDTKFAALGTATSDTWTEAREKTVAAWDRLQAAYAKAQAER